MLRFDHFEERVFDAIFSGAGQDAVLKDMRDAGVVGGRGGEGDGEEVFGVVVGKVKDASSTGGVGELDGGGTEVCEFGDSGD